jgi:predicted CxxxxCH...CXXCH cytochrome family protein
MLAGFSRTSFVIAALLAPVCSERRERPSAPPCVAWQEELGPAFSERCVSCHGHEHPDADYDLTSYLGALGPDPLHDSAARAGDPGSPLVQILDPRTADPIHRPFVDLFADVRQWVVECELRYSTSSVHEAGILDPRSGDHHGVLLRTHRWDFAACARCHGADFEGGPAHVACTACHDGGPTTCATCHNRTLLSKGAHGAHVPASDGLLDFSACTACHPTPDDYTDPGHLFTASGALEPPRARIRFGALARETPDPDARSGPPEYDRTTGTCDDVYCHGAVLPDRANAELTQPGWFHVGQGQAACGTCHGLPPTDHPQGACDHCHQRVAGTDLRIVDASLHVNGEVELGRGPPDCVGCHGSPENSAPPRDVLGRTATSEVTVGAHQAHVLGLHRLRGPIPCADCHVMPEELDSPGHIDHPYPAVVFPEGSLGLSAALGAHPQWDHASATCQDVYCHGGGQLERDRAASIMREPTWTAVGEGQAACGGCHGIPPDDGGHLGDLTLRDCSRCHPSVDAFGNIIVTGTGNEASSLHIDGVIDVL